MPQKTNPPTSFRLPFNLPDEVHPAVKDALRLTYQGVKDANDAVVALAPQSGATSARPSSTTIKAGQQYFDTTLGIPVFWSGTAWVNMGGTEV